MCAYRLERSEIYSCDNSGKCFQLFLPNQAHIGLGNQHTAKAFKALGIIESMSYFQMNAFSVVASSFRTINGFVHEESLTKHSSVAYTCPAQTSKSWEILHKFTCRDIFKEFTTTETCYLLSQRCDLANLQFCGLDPDIKYEGGSCGFICPTKFGEHTVLPNMVRCNGMTNCIDNSDEANCNTLGAESGLIACYYDENILVPTSSPPYCDESYYECGGGYHFKDEIDCNHETGKFVTTALPPKLAFWWAHPNYVCNSDTKFYMGEDCFDTSNGGINCTQIGRQATIYVPPFRMCTNPVISRNTPNDFRLCEGWREQMNCPVNKKNIALQCNVEGVDPNTKLTKYLVCNRGVSCTDGLDEKCETVTHNCRIHRHKICDGVRDCDFGEDEYRCDAFFTTVLCVRRLQGEFDVPYRFPILRTWVMDGVEDCLEGEDENLENWNKCEYTYMDPRMRKMVGITDYIDRQEKCKNYYIPKRSTELIALDQLCDNIESFVGETELCRISRNLTGISSNFVHGEDIVSVAPCVLGLDRNIKSMYNCELFTNNFDVGIWGLPQKSWFIEKRQKECKFLYAARYVMTSCLGLCIENITCPIKLLPTTACSKNPQNSATAVNLLSRYDTKRGDGVKLRIMKDRNYANDFFQCSNGRCVPFEKICNLADDCGDESDEKDCYNQYICKNSSERISLDKVCDKKVHCGDFSDECNERCSMRVIQSSHLRNYGWFIGVSSTFINFLVIIKSSDRLYNLEKHRSYFRDTLLVTLIAFGDLMVGVYLLLISIADNIIGNKYCFQRFEWLGSIHCKLLGILSTVGSQVSLFTMATLSVYRVYTIKNVMGSNFIGFHSKLVCSLIIILIILTSLIMSIAPIISVFEDYFINGLYYNDNTLFRGMVNKRAHASILQAHFGSANSGILETFSWKKIRGLVEQMFTKEPKNVKGTGIGFYGNAGVCLFKYFVKASDPQRAFSLATLFVNFLCFIIITFAYISVMVLTMFSSVSSSRSSYNKSLQRKISLIILSDAICWIPFIILGALNYLDVIDADEYYEFCSIVILPTNSLINPLIYHFNISRCHHKLTTIISTIRTTIMETSRANRTESHMKVSSAIRNEAAIQEAEQPTPSFYNVAEAEM